MAADTWQSNLSFSDRVAATSKMQVTYKDATPSCSKVEATKYGKSAEETIRKASSSLHEYHNACAERVAALIASKSQHSTAADAAQPDLELPDHGAMIGRYINAQHYRDGLFSEVFRAVLPEESRRSSEEPKLVALKVMTTATSMPPHDAAREARILTVAQGDNIVTLVDVFYQPGGRFIMVFPFLPLDLQALLHQHTLTAVTQRSILRDMFTGLAHLHRLGIIHRDIKPSNILLKSPQGPAYIADFGIAWSPDDRASEPANEKILDVGTTCYRPPELLFGNQKYNTSLDVWAAGCVAAQTVSLDDKTLFDAGDLGSELALIKSIFETLGTPDLSVWPEAESFPDWGKMNFRQYSGRPWDEILPNAEPNAVDLVQQLIVFESGRRLTAANALSHVFLS